MDNLGELDRFLPLKNETEDLHAFISNTDLQIKTTGKTQAEEEPGKGYDFAEIYKKGKEISGEKEDFSNSKEMQELAENFESMREISDQLVLAYNELIKLDPPKEH